MKKEKGKCVGKEVGRFISCLLLLVSSIHPQDYRVNPSNVLLQDERKDHEICTWQRIRKEIFKREDSQRVLTVEKLFDGSSAGTMIPWKNVNGIRVAVGFCNFVADKCG